MKRLTTLLTATMIGIGLLAGQALAQDAYPIDVAPILVERPDAPAAVPPSADQPGVAVAPGVALAPDVAAAPAAPVTQRPAGQLATTGADVTVGTALALGLLLTGAAALWYARRRRLAEI